MTRRWSAAAGMVLLLSLVPAAVSDAQDPRRVAIARSTYDVFELTTSAPLHELTLPLGPVRALTIDVTSKFSAVDVEILTPSGTPVDPDLVERFAVGPGEVPPLGAALFEEGFHVQAAVDTPLAGEWTVRVTLPADATAALGNISAFVAGGLSAGVTTSRPSYQSNDTAVLALLAFRDGLPVAGASANASVYTAGTEATPTIVTLLDNGQNGDSSAGDGLYTGATAGLAPGHYMVSAELEAGGERAMAATNFHVTEPLAQLAGTQADAGMDTNSDGLFEWIGVNIGVTVDSAGPYVVFASLRSKATGGEITAAARDILTVGAQSVEVPFAADKIRELLGVDGPWEIVNVRLVPVSTSGVPDGVLLDQLPVLGLTDAYSLSQLQRPLTQILRGLTESGVDTNANGLFDLLHTTFRVDTLRAGSYTWTGTLRSSDGSPVGVSSGQGSLVAGVTTIGFTFDGNLIGAAGLDGPYGLFDVAVYGPPGAAALLAEVGSTRPYSVSQFEGSQVTFERLIELTETVPIFGRGGVPVANGIRHSLLQILITGRTQAEAGNIEGATGLLGAYVNQIEALGDERLTPVDRARLVDLAARVLETLENP